jgi:hypothetical protein
MTKWRDGWRRCTPTSARCKRPAPSSPPPVSNDAKTINREDGELKVHDGPFAETREQFGGYYIIDAPDMRRAIELASDCPAVEWGHVEIRGFMEFR